MSGVRQAQIAEALGVSRQAVSQRAKREDWKTQGIPKDVRDALLRHRAASLGEQVSSPAVPLPAGFPAGTAQSLPVPAVFSSHELTAAGRAQMEAARRVLDKLEQLRAGGCSLKAACSTLIDSARAGLLAPAVVVTLKAARDARGRPSPDGLPSPRSLMRWVEEREAGGDLAPKGSRDIAIQPWHALAIALSQRPQGHTKKWIAEQIAEQWNPAWGAAPPSYDVVARVIREKISRIDPLKGRHTGSALKAHRFHRSRKTDHLAPFFEVHADGWATHFTAPHPVSGEFVTYEVWHYHCIATRYVPPFSIGLSESFEVIAKGLENCIREGGVPAILQTDSTGSVKNDRFELDPVTSIGERAGISIVHPREVGNSQANGIPENFNTWLDRESRELATYQGAGMDSLTLKRVKKITAKLASAAAGTAERARLKLEAQRMGKGLVFDSHAEACAWLESKRQKFNAKPHRALPKLRGADGKLRHQSPAEALQQARDNGWAPVLMDEASLIDLFRMHVRKTVRRGSVSPFAGQRYGGSEWEHYNGQEVQVAVDIMDWTRVWVKDLQGRLIGEFPLVEAQGRAHSFYEHALEKRANAQIKLKQNQIEAIEARHPGIALEAPKRAEVIELPAIVIPDKKPVAKDMSFDETIAWLYGEAGESPPKNEEAAG